MTTRYSPLQLKPLDDFVPYCKPVQELPDHVINDSPAVLAMTDFRQVTAITIEPGVSVDWALQHMKKQGVRLLLVTDGSGKVLGVITSTDVQGEKPMRVRNELGRRHADITVREVMTPHQHLEFISMDDVLHATVGQVVATLRRVGRRHALVIEKDKVTGQQAIRGVFSFTQISRQLGKSLGDIVEVATTFAEMEMVLNS